MIDPGEHAYGPRVHLHGDAWSLAALARLSSPHVTQTDLLGLLRSLYAGLLGRVMATETATVDVEVETRMAAVHRDRGYWRGTIVDPAVRVVVIDVIRGGIVPAQTCFEELARVMPLEQLRLDHLNLARRSGDSGEVLGADLTGSKVGGSLEGATVLLPDPMGATGSTLIAAMDHLVEEYGRPARFICMPLIATPEFLRAVLDHAGRTAVHTYRVDRGTSSAAVQAEVPGVRWDEERGLDERGYIVPGAGGLGEVLNNSWC